MIPRGARLDPRLYQIAVLALLLAYGALALDFDVRPLQCGAILATALGVQLACARVAGIRNDPRSARTFFTPRSLSMSAARALVNSSCHAQ